MSTASDSGRQWSLALLLLGAGCGGATPPTMMAPPIAELGDDATRRLTVVGRPEDGLAQPRDLEFAPDHPEQLWVVNQVTSGVVIYTHPGAIDQAVESRVDRYARHFMDKVSSLAFGVQNRFATCQESRDDWNDAPQSEDDFMGPTLWLADLDVFARVGQGFPFVAGKPEGSHVDMLHESPLCMGIAHERDNVYWAFDGLAGELVRYDFQADHGPGGGDHSDGIVRRYPEAKVTRVPDVAGHLALDRASGILYVCDTGGGRVMRLDTRSGAVAGNLPGRHEALAEYSKVEGTTWETLAAGLGHPSGIALSADGERIFVADHASGAIVAYTRAGIELGRIATGAAGLMGLTLGPDGKLWFVDREASTVVRIDP